MQLIRAGVFLLAACGVVCEQVEDTKFRDSRGFYTEPFTLIINTDTESADIGYTLDGTDPKFSSTVVWGRGPVQVPIVPADDAPGVTVRTYAVADGMEDTNTDTSTYIFPNKVLTQTRPASHDESWAWHYEMGPGATEDNLLTIPSLSLVADVDSIFGPEGILAGSDRMQMSMEMIYPNGDKGWSVDCGIEGRSSVEDAGKRGFSIKFSKKYGDKELDENIFTNGAYNGTDTAKTYDALILLPGGEDSLFGEVCSRQGVGSYAVDQFAQDSQIAMSGYGLRGMFVHLYLNGLYWGVYELSEKPDASFFQSYFGGDKDDWYVADDDGDVDVSEEEEVAGEQMTTLFSDTTTWMAAKSILEVPSFMNYMVYNAYAGVGNWPGKNYYLGYQASNTVSLNGGKGKIRFTAWDSEASFVKQGPAECAADGMNWKRANNGAWIPPALLGVSNVHNSKMEFYNDNSDIALLWRRVSTEKDFQVLFSDSVQRNCFHGGPLSDSVALARWKELVDVLRAPIAAEAGRWASVGAGAKAGKPFSQAVWSQFVDQITASLQGNCDRLVEALRNVNQPAPHPNYFNRIPAPDFVNDGEVLDKQTMVVPAGFTFNFKVDGTGGIVYTKNGLDPRLQNNKMLKPKRGGSGKGRKESVTVDKDMIVQARTKRKAKWSPLRAIEFLVEQDYAAIQLTEIMFHPLEEDAEYIELYNSGEASIPLDKLYFSTGIDAIFNEGAVLAGGEYGLLVKNVTTFTSVYNNPFLVSRIKAEFPDSKLSNGGEALQLLSPVGDIIFDLEYDDKWYPSTDGKGYSLVLKCESETDLNQQESWLPSELSGGSPASRDRVSEACLPQQTPPCSVFENSDDFLANGIVNNNECCDPAVSGPCGVGEGDCDSDDECNGNLVCGSDNCAHNARLGTTDDCCYEAPLCDEAGWPNVELPCGACTVLVDKLNSQYGGYCDNYCASIGRSCVAAWEEDSDSCRVLQNVGCGNNFGGTSDGICECSVARLFDATQPQSQPQSQQQSQPQSQPQTQPQSQLQQRAMAFMETCSGQCACQVDRFCCTLELVDEECMQLGALSGVCQQMCGLGR